MVFDGTACFIISMLNLALPVHAPPCSIICSIHFSAPAASRIWQSIQGNRQKGQLLKVNFTSSNGWHTPQISRDGFKFQPLHMIPKLPPLWRHPWRRSLWGCCRWCGSAWCHWPSWHPTWRRTPTIWPHTKWPENNTTHHQGHWPGACKVQITSHKVRQSFDLFLKRTTIDAARPTKWEVLSIYRL